MRCRLHSSRFKARSLHTLPVFRQTNFGEIMMKSIWLQTATMPTFPKLDHDIKTDVLIIGGGLTGILCAHYLTNAGIPCALVEADRLCHGTTGNTTAKITAQHGLIYHTMLGRFGLERTQMYLQANLDALAQYRELALLYPCDFQQKDNFVYECSSSKKLERELSALQKLSYGAEFVSALPLPLDTLGAVRFPQQAQFHPLKLAAALAADLNIYEQTPIQSFDGQYFYSGSHKIQAQHTVVATHFPIFNKHGGYFIKLYQHRSYVLALKGAPDLDGMYVDASQKGFSFRNYEDHLLLGGGSHRTGKSGGNWNQLKQAARHWYPNARETARWAAQDCMSLDDIPYIGRYGSRSQNLYVAAGFNKWGMTGSMVSATLLTDLLQGKHSPWEAVFAPNRGILRPQLFGNLLETTGNLLRPTAPRCPHLGCALHWNPAEHSWDCSCHGSRFSEDGRVLDGPANGSLPQNKKAGT